MSNSTDSKGTPENKNLPNNIFKDKNGQDMMTKVPDTTQHPKDVFLISY